MNLITKNWLIITIYCVYAVASLWNISSVGYYYDELLHAVAAQEILDPDYISQVHRVVKASFLEHTVPLMILYYVGPLKSYLLSLGFLLFSDSLLTLRVMTIACGAITLALTYLYAKKYFNRKTALLTLAILACDPSFILSSTFDWGPVALQNILKMILILVGSSIITNNATRQKAFLFGATIGLLLWDKLNSLWIILPTTLLITYHIHQAHYKNLRQTISYFLLGLGFGLPFFLFIFKRPFFYYESQKSFQEFEGYLLTSAQSTNSLTLLTNYSSNIVNKITTLFYTLSGTSIPNYILSENIFALNITGILIAGIIVPFCTKTLYQKFRNRKTEPLLDPITYTAFLTLSIMFFIVLTPHANGPHHMLMLYPLPHILLAMLLIKYYSRYKYQIVSLLIVIVTTNVMILTNFSQQIKDNKMKIFWKRTEITQLTQRFVVNKTKLIALDWGITLPVGFISHGQVDIRDLQAFYQPKCAELHKLVYQENYNIIMYSNENKVFPTYYNNCLETMQDLKKETTQHYMLYMH